MEKFDQLTKAVEAQRELMQDAERTIWRHPETGYKEWKTHAYLKNAMEKLGYTVHEAGDIPGFSAMLDTGRPGPTVALLAEMDSLICASHPECDPETGAVHACGHHAQSAALLGAAAALKMPGALDGLCGRIKLIEVPAEELVEMEFREKLRQQGVIKYFGGKVEFMRRGFFDDVDLCLMLHTGGGVNRFSLNQGMNGCITKQIAYRGRAAHAGGAPSQGINALYAATLGMQAVNSIRETFRDSDHVRVHPIVTGRVGPVNAIPDMTTLECYVRAATMPVLQDANRRVNRAFISGAVALGAQVKISDRPGYSPVQNDPNMYDLSKRVMTALVGEENVRINPNIETGSTDMGDISCVFPAIHPSGSGAAGKGHGDDYRIADFDSAVVLAARYLCCMAAALLGEDAKEARYILDHKHTLFNSIPEYLKAIDAYFADLEGVEYTDEGAVLRF